MRNISVEILHIFIMLVVVGFGLFCLVAAGGNFDEWNKRLKRKRRNRYQ